MASNRIGRINEEIQKELSSAIRNLKDPRVQDTMISITHVEATPDLRYAKIYVSFLEENKAADGLKGLKSASGSNGAGGAKVSYVTTSAPSHWNGKNQLAFCTMPVLQKSWSWMQKSVRPGL